ncbi:thiazole biosynthesis protein [Sodalis-like secondary symbiont of Drepanosiphum platanoidis]|uniref:thiazole biosynthesis protein n=1 Tax=Sodalis-like secondary symbiont of Drepanosiphum platanoidis TaxID=2994493 RepID=UPI003463C5C0
MKKNLKNIKFLYKKENNKIKITNKILSNSIVLDIRTEKERIKNPLNLNKNIIKYYSLYEISNKFHLLNQNKNYLLYCTYGLISKLQAIILYEKGYKNIKIYRP